MGERRCIRCSKLFNPAKPAYRYCPACFSETQPQGWTQVTNKPGVARHRIGGVFRLRTDRRSVLLKGDMTTALIFDGFQRFLTDIYGETTRISTVLQQIGLDLNEIRKLNEAKTLGSFALELCPKLREWLRVTIGHRPCDVLLDYYGLYGDAPLTHHQLAERYSFHDEMHAKNYLSKMISELRNQKRKKDIEELILEVAMNHLKSE